MKQIKGKNYYISLGYIDEEIIKRKKPIDVKGIQNIFVESKGPTALYVDDSDKDNIVSLSLLPVNEIQRSKDKFKFRILINPQNIEGIKTSNSNDIKTELNIK